MKIFLLLFILPCVFADIRCPGGVICPSAHYTYATRWTATHRNNLKCPIPRKSLPTPHIQGDSLPDRQTSRVFREYGDDPESNWP
ncbi:hypothetical protein TNCV_3766651 [Trichonephila clavipes]|nr:hypothetical protein TNCV_3766651 [Trichonephila clavipes]